MICLAAGTNFTEIKVPLPAGSWHRMAEDALKSDVILFLLPVISVLPFGDLSLKEKESRFLRIYMARKGKVEYVADRVVTGALSGGIVWTIALGIILVLYFLVFFPMEQPGVWRKEDFMPLLFLWVRLCLISGILANLGMAAGAAFRSVYMAYGLPFVAYYLLVIIHQRYLNEIYVIDPQNWLSAMGDWGTNQAGLWIFLILLLFVTAVLHGGSLYGMCSE